MGRLRRSPTGQTFKSLLSAPRRHDLAPVKIDESVPRGGVIVRDIAGLAPTEIVRLLKLDTDRPVLTNPVKA